MSNLLNAFGLLLPCCGLSLLLGYIAYVWAKDYLRLKEAAEQAALAAHRLREVQQVGRLGRDWHFAPLLKEFYAFGGWRMEVTELQKYFAALSQIIRRSQKPDLQRNWIATLDDLFSDGAALARLPHALQAQAVQALGWYQCPEALDLLRYVAQEYATLQTSAWLALEAIGGLEKLVAVTENESSIDYPIKLRFFNGQVLMWAETGGIPMVIGQASTLPEANAVADQWFAHWVNDDDGYPFHRPNQRFKRC